jgi:hypothetical protein
MKIGGLKWWRSEDYNDEDGRIKMMKIGGLKWWRSEDKNDEDRRIKMMRIGGLKWWRSEDLDPINRFNPATFYVPGPGFPPVFVFVIFFIDLRGDLVVFILVK